MKFMIFDTETNGLPIYKRADGTPMPADDPSQPRLASFSVCLVDEAGYCTARDMLYIRPDGWTMSAEATAINGLTTEYLLEHGVPVRQVLDGYTAFIKDGFAVASFGAQFDCKIMRGELRRAGMPDLFEETPNVCLMRACQGMKIEKANGKGGWPALADVCRHFGIVNEGEHQADKDAAAAVAIFLKLREIGKLPAPSIHRAKNHPGDKPNNNMDF